LQTPQTLRSWQSGAGGGGPAPHCARTRGPHPHAADDNLTAIRTRLKAKSGNKRPVGATDTPSEKRQATPTAVTVLTESYTDRGDTEWVAVMRLHRQQEMARLVADGQPSEGSLISLEGGRDWGTRREPTTIRARLGAHIV
jgi:hypothetical protein